MARRSTNLRDEYSDIQEGVEGLKDSFHRVTNSLAEANRALAASNREWARRMNEVPVLGQELAKRQSEDAQEVQERLRSILSFAARFDPLKELEALQKSFKFSARKPRKPKKPKKQLHETAGRRLAKIEKPVRSGKTYSVPKPVAPKEPREHLPKLRRPRKYTSGSFGGKPIEPKEPLPNPEGYSNVDKRQPAFDINRYFKGFLRPERRDVRSGQRSTETSYQARLREWERRYQEYEIELAEWEGRKCEWEEKQRLAYEVELKKWEERKQLRKEKEQRAYEAKLKKWEERKREWEEKQRLAYEVELKKWEERKRLRKEKKQQALEAKIKKWEERFDQYKLELKDWEENKRQFELDHSKKLFDLKNKFIRHKRNYRKSNDSLKEYFRFCINLFLDGLPFVLPASKQSPTVSLAYESETQVLVIEVRLPTPDMLPALREVKYIKSRDELKETILTERERDRLYDEVLYQVSISVIKVALEADVSKLISLVVFNGRVKFRDEATGKLVDSCIISLQSDRREFEEIQIEFVDAKACFRKLKGIGSGKLHGLVPVAPLLELNTKDDRVVPARSVTSELQEGENLAAMDWEDFEHLVREVFEREFGRDGGEVKITRASRDRGVDALAFDPDPIRGGKIVIQAKRYTNLVGVDAVRDLYGTVVSEGANLGILITTSQYGPESYKFAKDKPLRLLDGSNLLHLLEKHGYRGRIDLREAKAILAERESNRG